MYSVIDTSTIHSLFTTLSYINDIYDSVSSKILKYADDTKIYNKENSVDAVEGLPADLSYFVSWSKEWQMLFSIDKCKVMHLATTTTVPSFYEYNAVTESYRREGEISAL